jgi:hypothetical protein
MNDGDTDDLTKTLGWPFGPSAFREVNLPHSALFLPFIKSTYPQRVETS